MNRQQEVGSTFSSTVEPDCSGRQYFGCYKLINLYRISVTGTSSSDRMSVTGD